MKYSLFLGIILLIAISISGYFLLTKNSAKTSSLGNQNEKIQVTPTEIPLAPKTQNVTVGISGFDPQIINVEKGTRVLWINQSGQAVTVNSDAYPTNTLFPFLNLGEFDNGSSVSVVFDKSGKYTYHNHLKPAQTGTVIVK